MKLKSNKLILNILQGGNKLIRLLYKLFTGFWLILSICCVLYAIWSGCEWLINKIIK